MAHQRTVEFCLLFFLLTQQFLIQQVLELYPLGFIQHQDLLQQLDDVRRRDKGIDHAIHLLLGIVFDLHRLIGEEPQPYLPEVPHQLVLRVQMEDVLLRVVAIIVLFGDLLGPLADRMAQPPAILLQDDVLKPQLAGHDQVHPQVEDRVEDSLHRSQGFLDVLRAGWERGQGGLGFGPAAEDGRTVCSLEEFAEVLVVDGESHIRSVAKRQLYRFDRTVSLASRVMQDEKGEEEIGNGAGEERREGKSCFYNYQSLQQWMKVGVGVMVVVFMLLYCGGECENKHHNDQYAKMKLSCNSRCLAKGYFQDICTKICMSNDCYNQVYMQGGSAFTLQLGVSDPNEQTFRKCWMGQHQKNQPQ